MCYVPTCTLIPAAPPPLLHHAAAAAAITHLPSPHSDSESFAALLDSAVAHVARKQQQQISLRKASLPSSSIPTATATATTAVHPHGFPQQHQQEPQQDANVADVRAADGQVNVPTPPRRPLAPPPSNKKFACNTDSFALDDAWLSPTAADSDGPAADASANLADFSLFGDASVSVLGDLGLLELQPAIPAEPLQPSAQSQRQMPLQQRAILDSCRSQQPTVTAASPALSLSLSDGRVTFPESFKSDAPRPPPTIIGKKRPFEHFKDQDSSDSAEALMVSLETKCKKLEQENTALHVRLAVMENSTKFFKQREQELAARIKSLETQLDESHRAMLTQTCRS
ncbi:hypothetical protein HDU84_002151 [Entophlyctis sp. JEL0112]|nr:hypothetical protein HDU84_002151 [Entophlyctis sp. JEL0112]